MLYTARIEKAVSCIISQNVSRLLTENFFKIYLYLTLWFLASNQPQKKNKLREKWRYSQSTIVRYRQQL